MNSEAEAKIRKLLDVGKSLLLVHLYSDSTVGVVVDRVYNKDNFDIEALKDDITYMVEDRDDASVRLLIIDSFEEVNAVPRTFVLPGLDVSIA